MNLKELLLISLNLSLAFMNFLRLTQLEKQLFIMESIPEILSDLLRLFRNIGALAMIIGLKICCKGIKL